MFLYIYMILITIILFGIGIFAYFYMSDKKIEKFEIEFKDENGNILDRNITEKEEQDLAIKYIKPEDVVLELGARYGMVTDIILSIVGPNNVVAVDPDSTIINALKSNLSAYGEEVKIWNGTVLQTKRSIIIGGYGTHTLDECISGECIPNLTFKELENKYAMKFNTIIADCEGCIVDLILSLSNTRSIDQIKKILVEKDYDGRVDYSKMNQVLLDEGFSLVYPGFREVWIRKN